jgi:hypothetical protein
MIQKLVKNNPFIQIDLCLQQVKNRTKLKNEDYIVKSEAMLKDDKFKFNYLT